ncbi:MAG: energy-coupling factor transporter ATPase [Erysipelotrichaceae bacterium]|nr:energy-coupling factor transporter ATPase [Erysipelotrichaceae bacterium]
MSLIEVKNLTFSYNDTSLAIDNVSLNIEKGSYTAVIGHNGSGKSTLAKLLAGLLEAKSGEIVIDGLLMNEKNIYEIRKKLGIVFQNPDNQFIGSTVRDDIAFSLENRRVPQKDMDPIIDEYAKEVGLSDFLDKEPTALSGGQKQRVAIAGVMAMKPDILIFDEATSMLDPKGKADIKKLISELHDNGRFTIISITHDIEEVLQADDCLVLNKGKVYMHDKPEKVFARPEELRKIDLDIPFNLKVKEALAKNGIRLKNSDLKGMAKELWQLSSNH